jgi:hypothetical protein
MGDGQDMGDAGLDGLFAELASQRLVDVVDHGSGFRLRYLDGDEIDIVLRIGERQGIQDPAMETMGAMAGHLFRQIVAAQDPVRRGRDADIPDKVPADRTEFDIGIDLRLGCRQDGIGGDAVPDFVVNLGGDLGNLVVHVMQILVGKRQFLGEGVAEAFESVQHVLVLGILGHLLVLCQRGVDVVRRCAGLHGLRAAGDHVLDECQKTTILREGEVRQGPFFPHVVRQGGGDRVLGVH